MARFSSSMSSLSLALCETNGPATSRDGSRIMPRNDIPRGRRRICKSGRGWRGRGEGRVIFHAELMDAASFSSPVTF